MLFRILCSKGLFFLLVANSFFNFSYANVPLDFLTPKEKQFLQQHSQIRVGFDSEYAPIDMLDKKGQFSGLSADYFAYFSKQLGVEFVFSHKGTWAKTYQEAEQGEYDVLSAIHSTPERAKHFDFTAPYLLSKSAIITTRANQDTYTELNDLHGKVVALIPEYAVEEFIQEDHPDIQFVHVKDIADGLKEVAFGRVDAFIAAIAPTTYYLEQYNITNLAVAAISPYGINLSFAVRKDWAELTSILKKLLARMPEAQKRAIYQKWIHFDDSVGNRYRRIARILSMLLILVAATAALLWIWNRTLKTQVAKHTKELKEFTASLEKQVAERTQALEEANQKLHESQSALMSSNEQLKDMVNYDGLTEIANRRYLNEVLAQTFLQLDTQLPISFLLIDVDNFKQYNDFYGHQKGDECLRLIAATLAKHVQRQGELVARYGGEEFAIVLANTSAEQALEIAEQKRQQISDIALPHMSSNTNDIVTISVGLVTVTTEGISVETMINQADSALYLAKERGRNRVVVYEGE